MTDAASPGAAPSTLEIVGFTWPEVQAGDDLARLLLDSTPLCDGDVVVITSKVVSKAEGRTVSAERRDAIADEAVRVLARRGDSVIAETRHGLVLAAAGVDSSNVDAGQVLLLPAEPDGAARRLRERVHAATGTNIAVVISDTAGRAWRKGQVDLAIGCAGLPALTDLSGTTDPYGNTLLVTAPATADAIAAAGDLVKGKLAGRPLAVVRGLASWVLAPGEHGLGAAELVRPSHQDMFGLGTREAAVAAAHRDDDVALGHFPPRVAVDPDPFAGIGSTDPDTRIEIQAVSDGGRTGWRVHILVRADAPLTAAVHAGQLGERCAVLAAAYRLREVDERDRAASTRPPDEPGWHRIGWTHWIVV